MRAARESTGFGTTEDVSISPRNLSGSSVLDCADHRTRPARSDAGRRTRTLNGTDLAATAPLVEHFAELSNVCRGRPIASAVRRRSKAARICDRGLPGSTGDRRGNENRPRQGRGRGLGRRMDRC